MRKEERNGKTINKTNLGVGSLRENADVEAWLQRISQFENPATVPEGLGRLSKKSSIYLCRYFATKSHRNDPITL